MERTDPRYRAYVAILEEELIPATGCTEPIALAYAAAKARALLGRLPEEAVAEVCGNIIKNVKSVVVPNTGGLKGIEAAVAAGLVAGDASRALEALADVTGAQKRDIAAFLAEKRIRVLPAHNGKTFYFSIALSCGAERVRVTVEGYHTNIVHVEKNAETLLDNPASDEGEAALTDRSVLNVRDICEFASSVDIDDVRAVIGRQRLYNGAISEEGLRGDYGARIGKILRAGHAHDPAACAKAAAAAGSDARMSGCEMPVVIVSGSGNQGMTASLPVMEYARFLGSDEAALIRALCVSNLVTIQQKTRIGRLSAFCGAVSAGCGAAAGIAFLHGGGYDAIAHTIVNTLAIASGMVCDGAKPSCAAKISTAVEAGILGYRMYAAGQEFRDGEGIVVKGVDNTIDNVGRMAREGMRETDREIIELMTKAR